MCRSLTRVSLICGFLWLAWLVISEARPEPPPNGKALRADLYGDPLPYGAISRLGSARLKHALRDGSGAASLAFSPDGKILASGGDDAVKLWDVSTGKELEWFRNKASGNGVIFAADGKSVITCNRNSELQYWQVGTGKLLRQLILFDDRGDSRISRATFTGSGKKLALGDYSGSCIVMDAATGKQLWKWEEKDSHWTYIYISQNDKILVKGTNFREGRRFHGAISVFEVGNGLSMTELWKSKYCHFASFSSDSRTMITIGHESLQLRDASTGKVLSETKGTFWNAVFSRDDKMLATVDDDGVRIWDRATSKELLRLERPVASFVRALAFSPDGKTLAAGGDYAVSLFSVETGKPLHQFPGHKGPVVSLAFSPTGDRLASGGVDDGLLVNWDLKTQRPTHVLPGHYQWIWCVAYSPDGKLVATGDGSNGIDDREAQIRLWDVSEGKLARQFFGHLSSVGSLSFSPDGKTLASAGPDARIKVWDVSTGNRVQQIREDASTIVFSKDGKVLLTAHSSYVGKCALWQVGTWKKLHNLGSDEVKRHIGHASFLPDRTTVFTAEKTSREDSEFCFWDVRDGRLLRSLTMPKADFDMGIIALSPDGRTVAKSGRGWSLQMWDVNTGRRLVELPGQECSVESLAFSPDGRILASGGRDTTILLWDTERARVDGLCLWLNDSELAGIATKELAKNPGRTVPLLGEWLRAAASREEPFAKWIADLDSDKFEVREAASRQLGKDVEGAEFALRLSLAANPPLEPQRRIQQLLDRLPLIWEAKVLRLVADLDGEHKLEALQHLQRMGEKAEPTLRRIWQRDIHAIDGKPISNNTMMYVRTAEMAEDNQRSLKVGGVPHAISVLAAIGTTEARKVLQELAKAPGGSRIAREAHNALYGVTKRPSP